MGGPIELSVVVPLFDEEENLGELRERLVAVLDALRVESEIVLVNDGSRDRTADRLDLLHGGRSHLRVLHLSRNFGHQAAVTAGLDHARGQAVVVMDGDLQDPPELIPQFVRLWQDGHDVVYAVRRRRKESWFKRLGYFTFYRLLAAISDLEIPLDSGDFCLMDRRVVDALKALPERARFVRGLRTFVGFRQIGLIYDRPARASGTPKYTLKRLIGLAIEGLISFSSYPLRLVTYLGLSIAGLAAVLLAWVLYDAFYQHSAPRGWASILVAVLFMGATQLICLGIAGEYLRLIFLEAKGRPTYVLARTRSENPVASSIPPPHLNARRSQSPADDGR